ncbi:MAG: MFS transporter, partial [Clostridiales bacterium]|nr:MFS transporter [Clostridiales bacterium]
MSSLSSKLKYAVNHIKVHWKTPPEGKAISYKEFCAYSVGGIGIFGVTVLLGYITTIQYGINIFNALNVTSNEIMILVVLMNVFTIVRAPLISWMTDNTRSKYGKFRPYLIWLPIPLFALTVAIGWIPNMLMGNHTAVFVTFTVLFLLLQFLIAVYQLAFNTLLQVISPNQSEKEMMMGLGSTVYSLGGSIVNFVFPMVANVVFSYTLITGDKVMGINLIGTYQWIVPAMLLALFALGYWTAFGTKERAIISKDYEQRVGIIKGFAATAKNKYFWLTAARNILGSLRTLFNFFAAWVCSYLIKNEFAQSIAVSIIAFAFTPAMVGAPFLIKKFGKKRLVILSNMLTAAAALPILLFLNTSSASPYMILVFIFIMTFMNAVQIVTDPALNTQVYDWQQLQSGDRMEGNISQFLAILTAAVAIGTGLVQPAIAGAYGADAAENSLLNPDVIFPILKWCTLITAASSALAAIPMFFWDMTEKRHNEVIEALKVRAAKKNGELTEETAADLETLILAGDGDAFKRYGEICKVRAARENGELTEETAAGLESQISAGDGDAFKRYAAEQEKQPSAPSAENGVTDASDGSADN